MLLENLDVKNIDKEIVINENIKAPIQEGDIVGVVKYKIGDKVVETRNIVSLEKINEINFFEYVYEVLKNFI